MSESFAGIYYDGSNGRRRAVELRRIGASHYAIAGDGIERSGGIASLSITPRLARIARTIELPDGARVLLAHDAAIDGWFPRRNAVETIVDRLERHAYAVAAAIVISAATLVAGAKWGVPWIADRIAWAMPPAIEQSIGEQVLANLDRLGLAPSALDPSRRDALAARFADLAGDAPTYRLEFRNAPGVGANAFAIPGGTVVVTDQLVAALGDDREFDAVVAHEIGHQRQRHALRQALRGSLVAIVAALFAGDVSSAGAVVIAVPTFLLNSHYSRGFEEEADRQAFALLAAHDESPHWFAEAMQRLQSETPDDGQLAYLSSHPSTYERIANAESAAMEFAVAHPDLCPDGVCPGEEADDADDGDCDDFYTDATAIEPQACP